MSSRVLVAMSGGVDSSVAAYLALKKGYNVQGALMKMFDESDINDNHQVRYSTRSCCSLLDAEDARLVSHRLGIPFYVFNFRADFEETVIDPFVTEYLAGRTPNPCINCNKHLKFKRFLHRARELECDYIATGHYAIIDKSSSGRFLLKKGIDPSKDQTYVLYAMTQEELSRTIFPLGNFTKEEVRAIANEQGLVNAEKPDSQDICFAPDGDYATFIKRKRELSLERGVFVTREGKELGSHPGYINYTIGQRIKLGGLKEPLYVHSIDPERNSVTAVESKLLYKTDLTAKNVNLIPFDSFEGELKIKAKIRYAHKSENAYIRQIDSDTVKVRFEKPQRAVTPGQSVVFYDEEYVLGGGVIE